MRAWLASAAVAGLGLVSCSLGPAGAAAEPTELDELDEHDAAEWIEWDGAPWSGSVPGEGYCHFRIQLPPDSGYVLFELDGGYGDVDLRVATTAENFAHDSWDEVSTDSDGYESIELLRYREPAWRDGVMFVQIENLEEYEITCELTAQLVATTVSRTVRPGESYRGSLTERVGYRRVVRVDVPPTATAIRFDLHGVRRDVDLFVAHDEVPLDGADADYEASTSVACESLLITTESEPPLQPGRPLFALVQDSMLSFRRLPFRLFVTAGRVPPAEIDRLPEFAEPATPKLRALAATVMLVDSSGVASGTIVREDGLILTAAHAVEEVDEDDIVVAMTFSPRELTRDLFRARLVARDEDLDLALLRIDRTIYGSPVPADLRLPTCPIGFDSELSIGDDLYTAGYPLIGGSQARATISWSKGVISGFAPEDHATEIKTDALIAGGASGGSALDAQFRLIGVLQSGRDEVEDDGAGVLGYIMPVTALPFAWRWMITKKLARPSTQRFESGK